jgi:hypothetical protein
MTRKQRALVEK